LKSFKQKSHKIYWTSTLCGRSLKRQ